MSNLDKIKQSHGVDSNEATFECLNQAIRLQLNVKTPDAYDIIRDINDIRIRLLDVIPND